MAKFPKPKQINLQTTWSQRFCQRSAIVFNSILNRSNSNVPLLRFQNSIRKIEDPLNPVLRKTSHLRRNQQNIVSFCQLSPHHHPHQNTTKSVCQQQPEYEVHILLANNSEIAEKLRFFRSVQRNVSKSDARSRPKRHIFLLLLKNKRPHHRQINQQQLIPFLAMITTFFIIFPISP